MRGAENALPVESRPEYTRVCSSIGSRGQHRIRSMHGKSARVHIECTARLGESDARFGDRSTQETR